MPMVFIALGLGGLIFYVSYRYTSGKDKTRVVKNVNIQSDVHTAAEAPTQFKPIVIKEDRKADKPSQSLRKGEEHEERVSARPTQNVLDVSGLSLGEFAAQSSMESRPVIEEDLSSFATVFRQSSQKETGNMQLQKADNGAFYLRATSGIYTAFADPGTQLVGPNNASYEIGADNLLYRLEAGGRKTVEDKIIQGNFKDTANRIFRITKNSQLRLITPGGPGTFTGPDNTPYVIQPNGVMEEVHTEGNRVANTILGEGEFTGSDGLRYAVYNGVLFKPTSATVSFGAEKITGAGVFRDPAGQLKVVGEDGNVYKKALTGKLELTNIEGSGEFIGPDGAIYRLDGAGNVSRISRGMSSNEKLVKSGVVSRPRSEDDPTPATIPVQRSSVTGESRASENLLGSNEDAAEQAKIAKKLKAKTVYVAPIPPALPPQEIPNTSTRGKLIPIGQRIPFYTLTEVSTQFTNGGGMVEAVVAENVYFNGAKIEAGSRLYGSFTGMGTKNRMNITFNTVLLKTGEQLKITGFTYDASMRSGIESYYEPTAPFVIATRYANAALLIKLSEEQPVTQDNRPVGDTSYLQDSIQKTQDDLEVRYGAYNWLPAGTAGIFMLNASVVLTDKQTGVAGIDEYNTALKVKRGDVMTNHGTAEPVTVGYPSAKVSSPNSIGNRISAPGQPSNSTSQMEEAGLSQQEMSLLKSTEK